MWSDVPWIYHWTYFLDQIVFEIPAINNSLKAFVAIHAMMNDSSQMNEAYLSENKNLPLLKNKNAPYLMTFSMMQHNVL